MPIRSVLKKFREKQFPGRGGIRICAEKFGIHPQQWRDWESGKQEPRADYLQKLSEFMKVSVDELLADNHKDFNPIPGIEAGMPIAIMLPVFGDAAAATNGQDSFYSDESYETFEIPAGVGMVAVRGDSMEPLARDGQKVFLRPYSETPRNGDLVVVWTAHDGHARQLFKRWGGWMQKTSGRNSPDDVLVLISVNPIDTVNLVEHIRRREYGGHRIVAGVWYG